MPESHRPKHPNKPVNFDLIGVTTEWRTAANCLKHISFPVKFKDQRPYVFLAKGTCPIINDPVNFLLNDKNNPVCNRNCDSRDDNLLILQENISLLK